MIKGIAGLLGFASLCVISVVGIKELPNYVPWGNGLVATGLIVSYILLFAIGILEVKKGDA